MHFQVPAQARESFEGVCRELSSEAAKALKGLALAVRTMTRQGHNTQLLLGSGQKAVKDLKALLKTSMWKDTDLLAAVPLFTVASLLIDIVKCTERIAESVQELSSLAKFREIDPTISLEKAVSGAGGKSEALNPVDLVPNVEGPPPHVVLTVHEVAPERGRVPAAPASVTNC